MGAQHAPKKGREFSVEKTMENWWIPLCSAQVSGDSGWLKWLSQKGMFSHAKID